MWSGQTVSVTSVTHMRPHEGNLDSALRPAHRPGHTSHPRIPSRTYRDLCHRSFHSILSIATEDTTHNHMKEL